MNEFAFKTYRNLFTTKITKGTKRS